MYAVVLHTGATRPAAAEPENGRGLFPSITRPRRGSSLKGDWALATRATYKWHGSLVCLLLLPRQGFPQGLQLGREQPGLALGEGYGELHGSPRGPPQVVSLQAERAVLRCTGEQIGRAHV
mgnify:CR=1 FL=1